MPLEACMICLDNSEWMRNGDYAPTRLQAQSETVHYIANAKIQDNQESEVGLLSMAGPRVTVHCSMSRSVGTIMNCLKDEVAVGGEARFINGLKIAQLGLKNRQNKNQKQRIVMFVGSPVEAAQKDLVRLGKVFKKNNVSVDVINFGTENSDNVEKLEAFIAAINSGDSSHLVNIPPGPHVLADLVLSSSIMVEPGTAAAARAGAGAGTGAGTAGGVGAGAPMSAEAMDEDLAMAIRMSMEDERQRQEREAGGSGGAAPATPAVQPAAASLAAAEIAAAGEEEDMEDDEDDEDALLAQAIALSMAADGGDVDLTGSTLPPSSPEAAAPAPSKDEAAGDDEADIAAALQDKDFLENLLSSVPGVDKNDLAIDDILMTLGGDGEGDDAKKKEGDKK